MRSKSNEGYRSRTQEQWAKTRSHLRAAGSRWMQTGPSERVRVLVSAEVPWAGGDLWVRHRVIAGDWSGLHLISEPFDGYVYCVGASTRWQNGVVEFERVPAELLNAPQGKLS